MTTSHHQLIDDHFITSLFCHPSFTTKLTTILSTAPLSFYTIPDSQPSLQLSTTIQQITSLLYQNCLKNNSFELSRIQQQISNLYIEIERVRDNVSFQLNKFDSNIKEDVEDPVLEDDQLFDLPSIKRTLHYLQQKAKEISPNSSCIGDSTDTPDREELINDRINSAVSYIEESFTYKYEHFEGEVNRKIQKQQKTINNILETLNELHPTASEDKAYTLSSSKSASKLKTFFGFKM